MPAQAGGPGAGIHKALAIGLDGQDLERAVRAAGENATTVNRQQALLDGWRRTISHIDKRGVYNAGALAGKLAARGRSIRRRQDAAHVIKGGSSLSSALEIFAACVTSPSS